MNFILDTHLLIWSINEPSKLSKNTLNIVSNTDNTIFVSAATLWELQIKKSLGKITLPDNFSSLLEKGGFELLNIQINHINKIDILPSIHRDPFDRMLIAQSICENIPLVTNDIEIMKYNLDNLKIIQNI